MTQHGPRSVLRVALACALSASLFGVACAPPNDDDLEGDGDETDGAESTSSAVGNTAFCPAAGRISQGFHGGHDGVDIAAPFGTPIYATAAGVVTASGPAQGYGQWIRIRHDDGSMTEYGHMQRRDVAVGQRVSGGQRIALVGSEGRSSGPHLHLRTYGRAGDGRGINPTGYLGARGLSLPCSPGPGGSAGGGACAVRGDRRLHCANGANIPMHRNPWAGSPVVNHLRTRQSWFSCWFSGEPHRGGNSIWYWTQGDDNANWGFVPAAAVYTTTDPAPGLIRCGD